MLDEFVVNTNLPQLNVKDKAVTEILPLNSKPKNDFEALRLAKLISVPAMSGQSKVIKTFNT
jgi:hypothetical protein